MATAEKKETVKGTFKVDHKVGSKKDGSPKKVYKKGETYDLEPNTAAYFKSKFIIE